MKKQFNIILLAFGLALGFMSCTAPEADKVSSLSSDSAIISAPKPDTVVTVPANPTETFKGNFNGQEIIFYHSDFQTYTLSMGGAVTSGHLNTERGYGDDRGATVYVLDDDKPKKEQKYFVRTPTGSVYMLDNDRYVLDEAIFDRAPGKVKPKVKKTEEPPVKAVTEVKKKEPAAEKPVKKKRKSKKRRSKAVSPKKSLPQHDAVVKKEPAKKVSKATKKKKVVRKTKKKSRKKKSRKTKSAEPAAPAASGQ